MHMPSLSASSSAAPLQRAMLIGFVLLLLIPVAHAQEMSDFTLDGHIRQRSQLDKKSFSSDASAFDFHELRTRLNVGFAPTDRIETFVQVQDTRNFGDGNSTLSPPDGTLDLHQAYFKVSELFDAPVSLKLGRQKLVYGTQRLIGGVEWSNQARTFDGGVLAYDGETASVDLFAARLPESGPGEGSDNLVGLYSTWAVAGQTLDVFAILDNDTREIGGETQLTRFTPGVTLKGAFSQVSYTLEGAYQGGNQAGSSIGASLLSAFAKYTFDTSSSPSIGAGYTRLSGDDDPSDDEIKTFDTLFATNHKFYGFMDYFLGIPGDTDSAGLQDLHVKTSVGLSESISLGLKGHHFMQAAAPGGGSTEAFGQEIDLSLGYQFADPASVKFGVSTFFPGDAFAPDGDTAFWGYVMTSVNF